MNKRDDDEILEEHIRFVHAWNQRIAKQSASIELPCICHVPPPEGTVRIEIRLPKTGEWYWSSVLRRWHRVDLDFEEEWLPVAIIAQQYIYPTPVEACRMMGEAGGPIECVVDEEGKQKPGRVHCVDVSANEEFPFYVRTTGRCYWRDKIRVLKPNP